MSDLHDPTSDRRSKRAKSDVTFVKSYRYIRTAMVGLFVLLAAAVSIQSREQGSILSSISAYYYTSAQAVFVGVLFALGVSMIALKGTTETEDILLNVGGILAPVIAFVPTARTIDYRTALKACRSQGGVVSQGPPTVDCPSILALQEATEANVANNVGALLIVGFVGIVAAAAFRHFDLSSPAIVAEPQRTTRSSLIGIALGTTVYLAGLITFFAAREMFVESAHYVAAFGLFGCVVAVAVVNARRRHRELSFGATAPTRLPFVVLYGVLAVAMAVVAASGALIAYLGTFEDTTLWVETALLLLFATFWTLQTVERWNDG